jgi:hypothetical protein
MSLHPPVRWGMLSAANIAVMRVAPAISASPSFVVEKVFIDVQKIRDASCSPNPERILRKQNA